MRACRLGLGVLVCLGAFWARPAPVDNGQQSAASLYIEGRFLADDGQYDEAIKIIAQDLLSTFSRRLVYLDLKDPADLTLFRAIFEAFNGEFLEVELVWDAASRSFDVSGMTAISHGKDAAEVQRVIQDYKKR
jgi:hypothetical protein